MFTDLDLDHLGLFALTPSPIWVPTPNSTHLQIPTARRGYALSNMCDSERHKILFTLGDLEGNLDTFSVLTIA